MYDTWIWKKLYRTVFSRIVTDQTLAAIYKKLSSQQATLIHYKLEIFNLIVHWEQYLEFQP